MDVKQAISTLAKAPGVYQFLDKNGKIIYVGKAKNLRIELVLISIKFMKMVKPLYWLGKLQILKP